MKRHHLLVLLLIFCVAMSSMNNVCAALTIPQDTDNVINSVSVSTKSTAIQNSTDSVINQSNATIKGMWMKAEDIDNTTVNSLKKTGITDVYIKSDNFMLPSYNQTLQDVLQKFNNSGIRVNIWISCFYDKNGKWIDPQGKYAYTVKIPYQKKVKVPYTVKEKVSYTKTIKTPYTVKVKTPYKVWSKVNGKWTSKTLYKWTYKTKYKISYQKSYKWVSKTYYKWTTKTYYTTETRYGYNKTYQNQLISKISNVTKNYNINGIILDDVCYSGVDEGVASKNANATEAITSFVQKIYTSVKTIKPNITLSATLIPSTESSKYYGQDYGKLSLNLDYVVPKLFKGNYGKNSSWIASMTRYMANQTSGKPVVVGIQAYKSNNDFTPLNATELAQDLQQALNNGAKGFILYGYGFISPDVKSSDSGNNTSASPTIIQIINAANDIKNYIDTNHKLPAQVQISNKKLSMPQFLKLLVDTISYLNNGTNIPKINLNVNQPSSTSGDLINGNLNKQEYLEIVKKVKSYIESNGTAPGFITSSKGKIQYESLIYIFSKIVNFYGVNNRLPNSVSVDSWKISFPPSNPQNYLKATKNCQSTDPNIVALAQAITSGSSSQYQKAVKIFEWVRDNIDYSFYYNTKHGAVNTLMNKSGNCVDHSHLLVALARAAGIPAKYVHGSCVFSSGNTYGHVWAQLLVNDRWYDADATSSKNTLGVIKNWNTKTAYIKGSYIELPF